MNTNVTNRSVIDRLISAAGAVLAVVCLGASALLFVAHGYVHNQVTSQLADQHVTFPAAGSPGLAALPAADRAAVEKYAGQQLTTGAQAKVFADNYIKVHLAGVADGKTYSQVSALAQAAPTDTKLAGQVQTLFRGETLRGLLLNGYAFDTMGSIALIAAWAALVAGLLLAVLTGLGLRHARRVEIAVTVPTPAPALV
ncbi:MAG: hypothetical protein QOF57_844 [Frankiaceae bacterium]|jgi:hypothetical protein|nr:hypothetical protein [Frankiaceae bacterium]